MRKFFKLFKKPLTPLQRVQKSALDAMNNVGIPAPATGTIRIVTLADMMKLDAESFMAFTPSFIDWMGKVYEYKKEYEMIMNSSNNNETFAAMVCGQPFAAMDWTLEEQTRIRAKLAEFESRNVTPFADYAGKRPTRH